MTMKSKYVYVFQMKIFSIDRRMGYVLLYEKIIMGKYRKYLFQQFSITMCVCTKKRFCTALYKLNDVCS